MSMKSNSFKIRVRKSRFFMEKIKPFSQLQRVQLCSEQSDCFIYFPLLLVPNISKNKEKHCVPLPPSLRHLALTVRHLALGATFSGDATFGGATDITFLLVLSSTTST